MPQFIGLIHKDPDSDYGVSFPDFPGVVTAGVTLDEAQALAEEALAFHLDGLTEDREPIPEPSSLEAVMADPENRDGVAILVAVNAESSRSVRVNVTLPKELLAEIDRYAKTPWGEPVALPSASRERDATARLGTVGMTAQDV